MEGKCYLRVMRGGAGARSAKNIHKGSIGGIHSRIDLLLYCDGSGSLASIEKVNA
jgi:hypothetical protein